MTDIEAPRSRSRVVRSVRTRPRAGFVPCGRLAFDAGYCGGAVFRDQPWRFLGYLVDPASSHMLVSKIKPCMSKYKRLYCETANGSLNQLWFI